MTRAGERASGWLQLKLLGVAVVGHDVSSTFFAFASDAPGEAGRACKISDSWLHVCM